MINSDDDDQQQEQSSSQSAFETFDPSDEKSLPILTKTKDIQMLNDGHLHRIIIESVAITDIRLKECTAAFPADRRWRDGGGWGGALASIGGGERCRWSLYPSVSAGTPFILKHKTDQGTLL